MELVYTQEQITWSERKLPHIKWEKDMKATQTMNWMKIYENFEVSQEDETCREKFMWTEVG